MTSCAWPDGWLGSPGVGIEVLRLCRARSARYERKPENLSGVDYPSRKRQPNAQFVNVEGATGKNRPRPDEEPAGISRNSGGVSPMSQPLSPLKTSSCTAVFVPA